LCYHDFVIQCFDTVGLASGKALSDDVLV